MQYMYSDWLDYMFMQASTNYEVLYNVWDFKGMQLPGMLA